MVQRLLVSVGVRIVGGNGISVQNCTVLLADSGKELFNENTAVFAAGVFVNGGTVGLTVHGCEFRAGNVKLWERAQATSTGLYTGVAMASSVSFASPAVIELSEAIVDANSDPVDLTAPAAKQAASRVKPAAKADVPKPEAKLGGAGETPAATKTPTLSLTSGANSVASFIAAGSVLERPGLQNIGGTVQNIFNFGNTTPPGLAAQGGTVLPATLDQAVITGNTFTNLTLAAFLLGEIADLDASDNQVNCVAGFWALAPSQVQTLLNDPRSLALVGGAVALAMPLPQGDASATVTVPSATPSVYLYTGTNPSGYQDSNGNTWLPDASVQSVTITAGPGATDALYNPRPAPAIEGTSDPTLYQSERAGPSFSYTFTGLNPGFYSVTLDFAEIFYTRSPDAGIRIFDVSINGEAVLTNFDIGAAVGPLSAYSQTFTNIPSSNGQIVVQFDGTSIGSDHNAKINALSLSSVSSGAPSLGPGNESDSTLFFDQLAQIAWQSYASISLQARWRFDRNEMRSLTATGILLLDDDNLFNENSGSLMLTGNRIDGQIQRQVRLAAEDITAKSRAAAKTQAETFHSGNVSAFVGGFLGLVVISAVSRTVITSNMLTNGNNSTGSYGQCLFVANNTVQEAFITIMSNLFAGYITVPTRNVSDTTLDAYAQSWNFLNTTI